MALFLELPQINQMKIDSFSLSGHSKNGAKFEVKDADFFRTRDEASVALFKAACNGESFDEAIVIANRSDQNTVRYRMKLAKIDYYQTEDGVTESFGLKFTTLVVE
jgi:type VI protein secretion system component Hcp